MLKQLVIYEPFHGDLNIVGFYFTQNWTIIFRMNIMLRWRTLETTDWDHELMRNLFTEVVNQERRRIFFLISSNTIMLLCATSGIAPLEAPFIFHRGRAAATKTSLLHHEVWSSDENFFWKMQTMQPDRRLYSSAERPQSILVSDHQMEVCGPINVCLFGVVDVKICKTFCPPPSVFHWNSKGNKTCKVSRGASAPSLGD